MFTKKNEGINPETIHFIKKIFIVSILLITIYLVYQISNIISILFFALFLNLLFSPFLNYLNKRKVWDLLWITIIYLMIALFIVIVFFAIVPIFIKQISLFTISVHDWANRLKDIYEQKWIDWFDLPQYLKYILANFDIKEILESLKNNASDIWKFLAWNLKNFISNWAWVISSFTSAIFNFVLVFIFSFFVALERKEIRNFIYKILPIWYSKYIESKEPLIINSLSNWLRWQFILCISIFFMTLIWLLSIRLFWVKINEFFSLALIAGMMEFVPFIWPFIALLPAAIIAIWLWSKAFVIVIILYILIQQAENNILVPYVMWKALALSPFAVLLAMMIWASLFGIIWIVIAIPVVSIIQIFLTDYLKKR